MRRLAPDLPRGAERASTTLLVLVLAPVLIFGVVGLAVDAGNAVNRRATVDDVAQSAARSGATAVQQGPGAVVTIQPGVARWRAAQVIASHSGYSGSATVTATTVTATVTTSYSPQFLSVLGVGPWTYTGTHTAQLKVGVRE